MAGLIPENNVTMMGLIVVTHANTSSVATTELIQERSAIITALNAMIV